MQSGDQRGGCRPRGGQNERVAGSEIDAVMLEFEAREALRLEIKRHESALEPQRHAVALETAHERVHKSPPETFRRRQDPQPAAASPNDFVAGPRPPAAPMLSRARN